MNQRIADIEQWIDAILDHIQQMIESGEVLPDELYGQVADAIQDAESEIDQLRQGIGQEQQQPTSVPTQKQLPIGADLLWILSGGQEDAFVNYLRTYPDSGLNALLSNPQQLAQTIRHLQQSMPQGQRGQQDGIDQAPIDSSNIYGFKYDPKSGRLLVRFQSGSIYGYDGVPTGVFKVFQQGAVPAKTNGRNQHGAWWQGKMPSLGAAFYNLIRQGSYPYQRLS